MPAITDYRLEPPRATPDGSIRRFTYEREDEAFEACWMAVKALAPLLLWLGVVPASYVALLVWAK